MAKKQEQKVEVEYTCEGIDIRLIDSEYFMVFIKYNPDTKEGIVSRTMPLGTSKAVAVDKARRFFSQKMLLGRFVEKGYENE
jgi:hypothetical protein